MADELLKDLPGDLPRFLRRFGTDARCREYLVRARWPAGFRCKRWLLGTHHGAVGSKHLQAYLDDYVFRFNRRTARSIAHRFARVIQQAVLTPPTTYRAIVAGPAA